MTTILSFLRKKILSFLVKKKGIRRYIGPKRVVLLLALAFFLILTWDYYRSGALDPSIIERYREQYPIGTVVLFVLVYAISVIAVLPSLPLNLAAGFFWGGLIGGVYSTIGVTLGGWISFHAARWFIGQPLAKKFDNKWTAKVQTEFDKNGWKFVAFARINPIIPTGALNYLLGMTSLSKWGFLWATFIFLLPPSIVVAYIGDLFKTFVAHQSGVNEIVKDILIVSGALTFLLLIKFAFKILKSRS